MSKIIDTVATDIYMVLDASQDHEPDGQLAADYAMRIGGEMAKATLKRDKPRERGKLWASDLGKSCLRKHWYNFNMPEKQAPLLGHTKFKFLYGNILEEAVLYMAEEAGHTVTDQQARVEYQLFRSGDQQDWLISGRIDGVVDGVLMDVKTTSSYGFTRYKQGINHQNDSFGYLWQLGFYSAYGGFGNAEQGFIWIDKQNGHIAYTECDVPTVVDIESRAHAIIEAIETEDECDVVKGYTDEPYGKSGNMCLPIACAYCDFKKQCWPGLRTFAYSHKPVDLTVVHREPKAPEIT